MSDKFKIKENRRDDLWNVYDASEEVHVNLCNCPDHETAEEICIALNTRAPQAGSKLDLIKARIKGNGKTVELQSLSTDSVTNENKIKDALMLSAAWGGDLLISSENRARFKRIADVLCPD
jgi:hypothetical protein